MKWGAEMFIQCLQLRKIEHTQCCLVYQLVVVLFLQCWFIPKKELSLNNSEENILDDNVYGEEPCTWTLTACNVMETEISFHFCACIVPRVYNEGEYLTAL